MISISRYKAVQSGSNSFISPDHSIDKSSITESAVDPPKGTMHVGGVVGEGSLSNGFEITMHPDDTYGPVLTGLALGRTLFVKVNWKTPLNGIEFYTDKCSYFCGTDEANSLDIIKVIIICF